MSELCMWWEADFQDIQDGTFLWNCHLTCIPRKGDYVTIQPTIGDRAGLTTEYIVENVRWYMSESGVRSVTIRVARL
jgi:hypothetical protein